LQKNNKCISSVASLVDMTTLQCNLHTMKEILSNYCVLCVVGWATGVAQLDNVVYVVQSAVIKIFNADTLSPLNNDIHVEGMTDPQDMVVCRTQRQLLIADCPSFFVEPHCIWRVSVDQLQNEKWMETEYRIRSLSVTSQRLLVTPHDPSCSLRLVSTTDAAQIGVVRLPEYMRGLHHAVETTRGTCVVAHYGTSQDEWQWAVSRVVTCCVALFISCE